MTEACNNQAVPGSSPTQRLAERPEAAECPLTRSESRLSDSRPEAFSRRSAAPRDSVVAVLTRARRWFALRQMHTSEVQRPVSTYDAPLGTDILPISPGVYPLYLAYFSSRGSGTGGHATTV